MYRGSEEKEAQVMRAIQRLKIYLLYRYIRLINAGMGRFQPSDRNPGTDWLDVDLVIR